MNKPILSAEQAKALEALRNEWKDDPDWGIVELISEKINGGWSMSMFKGANSISLGDFVKALAIGFVVEQSPEERLRDYYEFTVNHINHLNGVGRHTGAMLHSAERVGIEKTLQILGIKIEGVNA